MLSNATGDGHLSLRRRIVDRLPANFAGGLAEAQFRGDGDEIPHVAKLHVGAPSVIGFAYHRETIKLLP